MMLGKILRYGDRDIIKVNIDGKEQGFYRSTGRHSKKAGEWLPFDGLVVIPHTEHVVWFDKSKYVYDYKLGEHNTVPQELHRYGTEELKAISEELTSLEIAEGEETLPSEINRWLNYDRSQD